LKEKSLFSCAATSSFCVFRDAISTISLHKKKEIFLGRWSQLEVADTFLLAQHYVETISFTRRAVAILPALNKQKNGKWLFCRH
jgi:hypothetical protein